MQWAANLDFENPENNDLSEIDIPLETFEILSDIIRASIVADKSNGVTLEELDSMDVCTWIFENQQHIGPIMNAFISSMPKAKPEETGKFKAVKTTAK